jgi:tetratricopeptide (TPR) repeat protein
MEVDLSCLDEDYDLAIADYTAMLEIDANCLEALKWRARAYRCNENWEKTIEDWQTLLRINPDFAVEEMLEIVEWLEMQNRFEMLKRGDWDVKSQGLPF